MKQAVVLSLCGRQAYLDQAPDVIELVTEGILEYRDGGWDLCYEESDLTGVEGVNATVRIEGKQVTLTRTGKLNSQMVFQEGVVHESLYRVEFGALMLAVCAQKVSCDISEKGGVIDLLYSIEIEHNAAGTIDYHLEIRPKE